jgi:tetratricopeptide (TPR) repeat protein
MMRDDVHGYRARALIYLGGLTDDLDRADEALGFVREAIVAAAGLDSDLQVSAAMGMACVLAERTDPQASDYAAEAIALCRRVGSHEQLAATLPTAARVCWQVGDLAGAREYATEAQGMHETSRRIARVVLLSAAAGTELAQGNPEEAVTLAEAGVALATELGVERELPLLGAVRARSYLACGDLEAAVRSARAALTSAAALSYDFPSALCLEVAALVAVACGASASGPVGIMLFEASAIRARGSRPTPPAFRAEVDLLRSRTELPGEAGSRTEAIEAAQVLLADLQPLLTGDSRADEPPPAWAPHSVRGR